MKNEVDTSPDITVQDKSQAKPKSPSRRKFLAAGALGRLAMAPVRHGHAYGLDPSFQQAWFVDPALAGDRMGCPTEEAYPVSRRPPRQQGGLGGVTAPAGGSGSRVGAPSPATSGRSCPA